MGEYRTRLENSYPRFFSGAPLEEGLRRNCVVMDGKQIPPRFVSEDKGAVHVRPAKLFSGNPVLARPLDELSDLNLAIAHGLLRLGSFGMEKVLAQNLIINQSSYLEPAYTVAIRENIAWTNFIMIPLA